MMHTSTRPSSMDWKAYPIASRPEVQPVETVCTGPCAPTSSATAEARELGEKARSRCRTRRAVVDVPAGAAAADGDVVVLQSGGATDCRTERDADPPGIHLLQVETRVAQGFPGGDQRELDVPVRAGDLLLAETVLRRVEIALGGDPGAEPGRVEEGDAPCRGAPVREEVPEGRLRRFRPGRRRRPR